MDIFLWTIIAAAAAVAGGFYLGMRYRDSHPLAPTHATFNEATWVPHQASQLGLTGVTTLQDFLLHVREPLLIVALIRKRIAEAKGSLGRYPTDIRIALLSEDVTDVFSSLLTAGDEASRRADRFATDANHLEGLRVSLTQQVNETFQARLDDNVKFRAILATSAANVEAITQNANKIIASVAGGGLIDVTDDEGKKVIRLLEASVSKAKADSKSGEAELKQANGLITQQAKVIEALTDNFKASGRTAPTDTKSKPQGQGKGKSDTGQKAEEPAAVE